MYKPIPGALYKISRSSHLVLIPHPQPVEQLPNGVHSDHSAVWQSTG